MSLAVARVRAAEVAVAVREGDATTENETRTVAEGFKAYYTHIKNKYRRPDLTIRLLEVDITPFIGKKILKQLTRADCTRPLQTIIDRGSPVSANRTLEALKKALRFCEQRGWIENNPVEKVTRESIGGREKARERNLSFDELQAFMTLVRDTPRMEAGTKWALRLIMLTGLRATEALNLKPNGVVTSKMNRQHRVPMTPHVKALFRVRPANVPGKHGVLAAALRKHKLSFTPHDLRRTFASRLSDLGVMPHVIEKMLDHKMEGVMAVYNRAEFWPERVAAQRLWGFKIAELRRKA